MILIYALIDNITEVPFYVGSTNRSLDERLQEHIYNVKTGAHKVHRHISTKKITTGITLLQNINDCDMSDRQKVEMRWVRKFIKKGYDIQNEVGLLSNRRGPVKRLTTIKVTKETVINLNVAAAVSGKTQFEMANEASQFVLSKYMSKSKK